MTGRSFLNTSLKHSEYINSIVSKIAQSTEQDIIEITKEKYPNLLEVMNIITDYWAVTDTVEYCFALNTRIENVFNAKQIKFLSERFGTDDIPSILTEINEATEDNFYYMSNIYYIENYNIILIDKLVVFIEDDDDKVIDNFGNFTVVEKQEMAETLKSIEDDLNADLDYSMVKNQELASYLQNSVILE